MLLFLLSWAAVTEAHPPSVPPVHTTNDFLCHEVINIEKKFGVLASRRAPPLLGYVAHRPNQDPTRLPPYVRARFQQRGVITLTPLLAAFSTASRDGSAFYYTKQPFGIGLGNAPIMILWLPKIELFSSVLERLRGTRALW